MRIKHFLIGLALAASVWANVAAAEDLVVTPERPDGVYRVCDTARWHVEWHGREPVDEATYVITHGGRQEIARGTLPLAGGTGTLAQRIDEPGAVLAEITVTTADGTQHRAKGGAVAAPDRIKRSAERPADFDAFWAAQIAQLEEVPLDVHLERAASNRPGVAYWKITMRNVGGAMIRGQLARPTEGEKLPALFIPQWAGVYRLDQSWATDRAREGWLVLNLIAHDLPIDQPPEFYRQQFAGPLNNYWAIGNDDRETSYFLRMYLSCVRAIEYVTQRPDWDGRTLVVVGASQGGQQTLVTAALCPQVTAALANVPAGSDMLGPRVGRRGGWPQWYDQTAGKDADAVHEASRYYDVVNFAPRIRCPVLVGLGLIDQVCPAEGILATVNQISAPKEVVILPLSEHQEKNGSQRPFYDRCYSDWLPALVRGEEPPVKATPGFQAVAATSAHRAKTCARRRLLIRGRMLRPVHALR